MRWGTAGHVVPRMSLLEPVVRTATADALN